jgi:hypothetical protein
MFSARERTEALQARDLIRLLGFASPQSVVRMINQGCIINCPVTAKAIEHAYKIFGPDVATLRRKSKQRKPITPNPAQVPRLLPVNQTLDCDIMFVNSHAFLISVSSPLRLTLVNHLGTGEGARNTGNLRKALDLQINTYRASAYVIIMLQSDNEGGIVALAPELEQSGIRYNPSGPGQHVARIERKIQEIKELARSVLHGLPFLLPEPLTERLILFAVSRSNLVPHKSGFADISPREAFTGRKLDFKRDLRCGFGDYMEVVHPVTDNTMKKRTEPCIALLPRGNLTGSIYVLAFRKKPTVLVRDIFTVFQIVTSKLQNRNMRKRFPSQL